ncbi:uncharacterized protein BCR38DRAFT_488664 [Pseudomassariella vexata]|uniref:Methyltransferase domain-containing protein n=1 Tax=Pseudomassariella vexata TaxID=1141098 RepID=A0A1Y2DKJ3_9PEZI|nr:uncharacterized protein BCR38DRAFT_488664 [Pseudomassariella vexata]ORY59646.1 hypothetical protein BCR38DRAFT_488664 [Pseudomassariella vexata]
MLHDGRNRTEHRDVDLRNSTANRGPPQMAPVEEPEHVLAIGTGTRIWAVEFAEEHPSSKVIGTDLSQVQHVHAALSNPSFAREDIEMTGPADGVQLHSSTSDYHLL